MADETQLLGRILHLGTEFFFPARNHFIFALYEVVKGEMSFHEI